MNRRPLLVAAVAAVFSLGISPVFGQTGDYPNRNIRMIVPFAPGGNTDVSGRLIAERLTERLGKPVLVENKPGAGSLIGVEQAAKSAPDGYTMVMGSSSIGTFPALVKDLRFDVLKDLAPITVVNAGGFIVTVTPAVPANSLQDLINYAKANPGKLNIGYEGASALLTGAYFSSVAGIKLTPIPYKGTAPLVTAQLANEVQISMGTPITVKPHIDSGKLKGLALTSRAHSSVTPNILPAAETGMPGFDVTFWIGLLAPGGTPKDIVARLNREIVAIIKSPETRARMVAMGSEPVGNSAEEFAAMLATEVPRWTKIAREAGVQPE